MSHISPLLGSGFPIDLIGTLPEALAADTAPLSMVLEEGPNRVSFTESSGQRRWTVQLRPVSSPEGEGEGGYHITNPSDDTVSPSLPLRQLWWMVPDTWEFESLPPTEKAPMSNSSDGKVKEKVKPSAPSSISEKAKTRVSSSSLPNFQILYQTAPSFFQSLLRYLCYAPLPPREVHQYVKQQLLAAEETTLHKLSATALMELLTKRNEKGKCELRDEFYTVLQLERDFESTEDKRKYANRAFVAFQQLLQESASHPVKEEVPPFRYSPEALQEAMDRIQVYVDPDVYLPHFAWEDPTGSKEKRPRDAEEEEKKEKEKRESASAKKDGGDRQGLQEEKSSKIRRFEDCDTPWEQWDIVKKERQLQQLERYMDVKLLQENEWLRQYYLSSFSLDLRPTKAKKKGKEEEETAASAPLLPQFYILDVPTYQKASALYNNIKDTAFKEIKTLTSEYLEHKHAAIAWLQSQGYPVDLLYGGEKTTTTTKIASRDLAKEVEESRFTPSVAEEIQQFFARQKPLEERLLFYYTERYEKLLWLLQRDLEDYLNLKALGVL